MYKPPSKYDPSAITIDMPFNHCIAEARDDHIIIYAGDDGILSVHRRNLRKLGEFLVDAADVWEDVRT